MPHRDGSREHFLQVARIKYAENDVGQLGLRQAVQERANALPVVGGSCLLQDRTPRFNRERDGHAMLANVETLGRRAVTTTLHSSYKIFHRYKDCGLHGQNDRSRAPYRQPNRLPYQIERAILGIKKEHTAGHRCQHDVQREQTALHRWPFRHGH